ncbi:peptidoglycan DD-metalloendopeptidase family protein [uncultured Kriegella sp.]|uniref:peptidoglycan DD-metalloendopeptidase family protein n=1 Tax=uncultured Kriegella sp. TaxID=1798910 RepID=UPI0030D984F8|tara:strand:+ start:5208 stop:6329 length:1122 start_codon:yes stop_codon:yes gene_type:complete
MISRIFPFVFLCILGSCKQVQKISDVFVRPTPREIYARNFEDGDLNYFQWNRAFELALEDSLQITLPFYEVGEFPAQKFPVYGFNMELSQGEKLVVSVTMHDSIPFFIDLYRYKNVDSLDSKSELSKRQHGRLPIEFPVQKNGTYKILLQPELYKATNFQIELYTRPTLTFPVAGVSDKAIQSFWGASRSNGERTHEGVDIFAPRLTAVLAATDGRIGYTGERGLGGRQVWLREGVLGKSFYYAHLDSIAVTSSKKVWAGDTLGFVGNTGNARTTAPHLHFGIYTKSGAIDPLPFIRQKKREKIALERPATSGFIVAEKANMRLGADVHSTKLHTLEKNDTITIFGKTVNWYHIRRSEGTQGFIYHTLVHEID